MNMYGISENSFSEILAALKSKSNISTVKLFGSRAKGNYKSGSDIDLAVFGNLNQHDLIALSVLLNEQLPIPYKVDLVLYDQELSTDLREHIDRIGIEIYKRMS
ncbi:MAG: nucleotidyltransferase domain-containing protein [Crocinitomicaceae bacterium]|nr:nucleotidyltransferase domain-containing protein [Crocinitomicaceae bacterium]MBK8925438.1 nucleotidyltransferase domain-containing protein [Crocinitomicaceae bacterium]